MTFEQFQMTRLPSQKGYAYLAQPGHEDDEETLFIEDTTRWPDNVPAKAEGRWYLLLANLEWITDDLAALERRLYKWAESEGYFEQS